MSKPQRELAVNAGGRGSAAPGAGRLGPLAAALLGALAFAVLLVAAYPGRAPLAITTDDPEISARGFYPVERAAGLSYTWASPRAELSVPGLDRRIDWHWTGRVIVWRPAGIPLPHVRIAVDGIDAFAQTIEHDFELVDVTVPRRPGTTGATLTVHVVPGFVASPATSRELGVALESMSLTPAGGWLLPPSRALVGGTLAALALGAALAATPLPALGVLGCVLLAAGSQTWLLTRGLAAYGIYPLRMAATAFWLALGTLFVVRVLETIRHERIGMAARAMVAVSMMACYLKLLILLHPGMPIGDGVFHAHRLEFVLAGRFFFTSLAPGNYSFPYPILLYLFAAPFSFLAHDTLGRVAMLRIVVTAADAVAGALLYWMVVRAAANRLVGVIAVVWYHLVPATAWIMTWGNLTNAFGQTLFVTSLAAVVAAPIEWARPQTVAALTVLATAALLTHPSTCAILVAVLTLTTVLYWWQGGPELRGAALGVGVATLVAAIAAFVLYYAWFPAVYLRELGRVASETATQTSAQPGASFGTRVASIPGLAGSYFGWPAVIAASLGAWRLSRGTEPPRLTLLLLGWAGTCVLYMVIGVLTPVEMRYHFATFPAVALAAAYGSSWAWRDRLPLRICATLTLGAATWVGVRQWMAMLG